MSKGKAARGWFYSIVVLMAGTALAASAPGYKLVNTYKVGGDGGWNYLIADAVATTENPHLRRSIFPDSFVVLVFGK